MDFLSYEFSIFTTHLINFYFLSQMIYIFIHISSEELLKRKKLVLGIGVTLATPKDLYRWGQNHEFLIQYYDIVLAETEKEV